MAIQKKHGKGRLDKWYKLAKEKGYRARAAFKLIQLNKKYNFLESSKVLIDLCAAPGSWCQVAAEVMPTNSLIVGVDLAPIKPIPKVITFQSDITTEKCRATLRGYLKTWKADCVLHDGAPNVGTAWVQDAFTQAELVLQSLKLATEFLRQGGTFVTKVFRSRDFNNLMWVFNQLFDKVEATKPPSSRNVSAEIFVVCRGYKAPIRLDPKFLDPKTVFEELPDSAPNNEAKVFKPELKKRKRDGYEEGEYTQFKEEPASKFIETNDPIQMLGSLNRLSFSTKGTLMNEALAKLPETTAEVRACCNDLKVLGKKDFRLLLKWRLSAREKFGLSQKKDEVQDEKHIEKAEVAALDEELKLEQDLEGLKEKELRKKKKEKRKANELKRKEIIRMQLHMITPREIGLEQEGPDGEGSVFALKTVDKFGGVNLISNGKMSVVQEEGDSDRETSEAMDDSSSDEEDDFLERELDEMYEQYLERKSEADAKFRAKKARKEHEDGEWHGFGLDKCVDLNEEGYCADEGSGSGVSDFEGDSQHSTRLLKSFDIDEKEPSKDSQLSKSAALFFDQPVFDGIEDDLDETMEKHTGNEEASISIDEVDDEKEDFQSFDAYMSSGDSDAESDKGIEIVKADEGDADALMRSRKPDIDIITAEAMSLAQQIASGKRTKKELVDEGFNRWAFRDRDGLPDWFLDDEDRHSKPIRPITAEGAAAIKEKMRAMNARPIKKVQEAKARKKMKAAMKLEKLKKKSALLAEEEGLTEKEKANSISKMLAKAAKKKPKRKVTVVVARGANKGKGRPKGVKGRYKIVDARMKKDVRALKRLQKK